jgi:hypothetical protein
MVVRTVARAGVGGEHKAHSEQSKPACWDVGSVQFLRADRGTPPPTAKRSYCAKPRARVNPHTQWRAPTRRGLLTAPGRSSSQGPWWLYLPVAPPLPPLKPPRSPPLPPLTSLVGRAQSGMPVSGSALAGAPLPPPIPLKERCHCGAVLTRKDEASIAHIRWRPHIGTRCQ